MNEHLFGNNKMIQTHSTYGVFLMADEHD